MKTYINMNYNLYRETDIGTQRLDGCFQSNVAENYEFDPYQVAEQILSHHNVRVVNLSGGHTAVKFYRLLYHRIH